MKYNVKTVTIFSETECRDNPSNLYVFGDNMERVGRGGQAVIRYEPNSIGIATKKSCGEFMHDSEYTLNQVAINKDIEAIKTKMKFPGYKAIVFPVAGLGWGLANMQLQCPKTALYLCKRIMEEFGFNNLNDLINETLNSNL